MKPLPKKRKVKNKPFVTNGWLKLWLKIIDKEMDNFHVEDFTKKD